MKSIFSRNILVAAVLCGLNTSVHAAGFALANQAGSGTGNAFAGSSVMAEDASITWFNPAAMTELESGTHISTSVHVVMPEAKFTNAGSRLPATLGGGAITGKNDDGGHAGIVPGAYAVRSLNDKVSVGLSVNAPFGLGTKYDDDWVGRYHSTESNIKTINVNPSIAYKVNDQLSIGAGASVQELDVELKRAVHSVAACLAGGGGAACAGLPDGKVDIVGKDVSVGFNAGLLYKPSKKTKVGVSYRSGIKHDLEGNVKFAMPALLAANPSFSNGDITAAANLPASMSVSVGHKVSDKVEVMGDITRTKWSSFDRIKIDRTTGTNLTNDYQGWEDSTRYSIGASYQYNDRLKLRGGIARDGTPIPNAQLRSPRTPDNDRTWVALGANYKIKKNLDMDVAYTHISTKTTPIENLNSSNYLLQGNYDSKVDVVGVQLNWAF
ncbi:porin [Thiothrix sp.]|uniref:OmpP1/FadL family transporter n=1 Tax=Thiothrix sp. TaxID=1032 RepID=UPI002579B6E2|nr:porin [Thiothrix sp.]